MFRCDRVEAPSSAAACLPDAWDERAIGGEKNRGQAELAPLSYLFFDGQIKKEGRSLAQSTFCPHVSMMQVDELLHDGQPQTC